VTENSSHLAVGAIVKRGSDILLVSEAPEDPTDALTWALPGGNVADGETVGEALRRRVAEEAGLVGARAGRMVWLARYPVGGELFETLAFEVLEASTKLAPRALKPPAEWVPFDEAVERLGQMWFSPIRDPAVAYLTGRAPAATVWTWSRLDRTPETVPALPEPAPPQEGSLALVAPDGERDEHREDQH
jgi:ADP-ribose pyrophosphatase YjhB (NUDIX family)